MLAKSIKSAPSDGTSNLRKLRVRNNFLFQMKIISFEANVLFVIENKKRRFLDSISE